jgi:class 3 adenylate cyclase
LSADLAGSTAFKQQSRLEEWQDFFREFYRQLPAMVERHWLHRRLSMHRLEPWKLIGDEIVFSMPLTHHMQARQAIDVFRSAVSDYRKSVLRQKDARLDVKCAGWTAGFPVGNIIVEPLDGLGEDYVGPGMDIGFRLVKASSPRRMLLSVELAWLLTLPETKSAQPLFVGSGLDLKGVARGSSYPCIWLDNFHDHASLSRADKLGLEEERLRGVKPNKCDVTALHSFCSDWLKHMGQPFVTPFIVNDPVIGKPPLGYDRWLSQVTEKDSQGTQRALQPASKTKPVRSTDIVNSLGETIQRSKAQQPTPKRSERKTTQRRF